MQPNFLSSTSTSDPHPWWRACSLYSFSIGGALVLGSYLLSQAATAAIVYNQDGEELSIFGRVQAALVNNAAYQEMARDSHMGKDSIYTSARLGLAGRSQISQGFDAIGMAEWESSGYEEQGNKSGSLNYARYLFAGIDAYQYGTLLVGRGDSAYYTIAGSTDIFNVLKGHASDYYLLGDQRPSQVMYSLRALDWDFKFSYMFPTDTLGNTPLKAKREMAVSVSSKLGENITVAYGIDYTRFRTNNDSDDDIDFFFSMMKQDGFSDNYALAKAQNQTEDKKVEMGGTLAYGTFGQGLYAAVVLATTNYKKLEHHIYTFDSAVSYTFDNGVGLSCGYGYKGYNGDAIVSEFSLGASYKINANFNVFAEAQFDLGGHADEFYGETAARKLNLNEDKYAIGAEFLF